MPPIISVEGLVKSYGQHNVLDGVSFSFEPGQIIGLLGPNGCGKTTLIKILTGLINDHTGKVYIDGHETGIISKSIVAYMPDKSYIPAWMNPVQAVNYLGDFFADFDKEKALNLIDRFELPRKQKVKSMSKGMQQKLLLVLVMCRQAKLYILDEPLGGVDPAAREFILDFIIKNRAPGSTVLLSTHLINDVEKAFDRVIMIEKGKVAWESSVEEIQEKGHTVEEVFKEVFSHAWQVD